MKKSAGILLYHIKDKKPEFLLVHPGGPFWKNKDQHAWSIPKGEIEENENIKQAAIREFQEETGQKIPAENLIPLNPIKQKGGKIVYAFAVEGELNPENIQSNYFEMEWPPKSGKIQKFPEIDKAGWFDYQTAQEKIIPEQFHLIEEFLQKLDIDKNLL